MDYTNRGGQESTSNMNQNGEPSGDVPSNNGSPNNGAGQVSSGAIDNDYQQFLIWKNMYAQQQDFQFPPFQSPQFSSNTTFTPPLPYQQILQHLKPKRVIEKLNGLDKNRKWMGPAPIDFIENLEQWFLDEEITEDNIKLARARDNIVVDSYCYKIYQNDPSLRRATDWEGFRKNLLLLINTKDAQSVLQNFTDLISHQWKPVVDLTIYLSQIQNHLDAFITSSRVFHKIEFPPQIRKLLLFSVLYSETNNKVRSIINDNLDLDIPQNELVHKLNSKTQGSIQNFQFSKKETRYS